MTVFHKLKQQNENGIIPWLGKRERSVFELWLPRNSLLKTGTTKVGSSMIVLRDIAICSHREMLMAATYIKHSRVNFELGRPNRQTLCAANKCCVWIHTWSIHSMENTKSSFACSPSSLDRMSRKVASAISFNRYYIKLAAAVKKRR